MKLLITGGVGFIGSHLCDALLARGDRLVIVDDFSDAPYPTFLKRQNQARLLAEFPHACQVVEACITDIPALHEAARGVDAIVHLAGLAGVRPSFAAPARYARVNVEGTAAVLEVARSLGIHRLALASSSSVYGDSTPLPAHEDAAAIVPESPYAASKRSAELLAQATLKAMPETACAALRFFTVYGPRQRPEMAITTFCRKLLADEPLVVFGDGSMRRDYTHVHDIVRGILLALEHTPRGFHAFNLGSGAPISLGDLVRELERVTGHTARLQPHDKPLGDVAATFADISRAREQLGWAPTIALREGLGTVVAALRAENA